MYFSVKWTLLSVEAMDSEGERFVVSILSDLEDVIFLILKHLPMKDLHRSARSVTAVTLMSYASAIV